MSSTPLIVTVCARFQLLGENVRLAGETVPSVVSLDISPITTSAVGTLSSTTEKVAELPPSEVSSPETGLIVIPAGGGGPASSVTLIVNVSVVE
ncbi:MAG: hypothetical protein ACKV2Q_27395 [Planctomycetaceae bacterium]